MPARSSERKIFVAGLTLFFDDGGVMNDNLLRGPQWQRLVAEFFVPLLGGTAEAWREANRVIVNRILHPEAFQARMREATEYAGFDRRYQFDWLRGMCELVGIATPPEDVCVQLAHRATAFVIPRVRAAFPGAADAIRLLYNQGYTLHTASGEPSFELAGHLAGMGVRDCFDCLYGPDLIDTFKISPAYYERIFADLNISPSDALIIDDSPDAVQWATQVGAHAALISNNPSFAETETLFHCKSAAELPALLQRLS
jgi:HAD superfamily hydrolase (TIGR01509 family)